MIPHGWELFLVIVIGLLLFGSTRLPSVARALGQGITELKESVAPRTPEERGKGVK